MMFKSEDLKEHFLKSSQDDSYNPILPEKL